MSVRDERMRRRVGKKTILVERNFMTVEPLG